MANSTENVNLYHYDGTISPFPCRSLLTTSTQILEDSRQFYPQVLFWTNVILSLFSF